VVVVVAVVTVATVVALIRVVTARGGHSSCTTRQIRHCDRNFFGG